MHPKRGLPPFAQAGMTLIEVLVALVILATLAVVSQEVISRSVTVRLAVEEQALAQLCADNLLVQYHLSSEWPGVGSQTGDMTQGRMTCYWRADVQATPLPAMRRVDIGIYATSERRHRLARVSGFIGEPSP